VQPRSLAATQPTRSGVARFRCRAARLEFVKGIEEPTIPEVRLSRSRTGASGTALFVFDQPSIFQAGGEMGDITGEYKL
jgi:photosystem II protein